MQIGSLPSHGHYIILVADHRTDPASEKDARQSIGRGVDDEGVAQTTPPGTDRNEDDGTVSLLEAIPNTPGSTAVLSLTLPVDSAVPTTSTATLAAPADSSLPDRSVEAIPGGARAELGELAPPELPPVAPTLGSPSADDAFLRLQPEIGTIEPGLPSAASQSQPGVGAATTDPSAPAGPTRDAAARESAGADPAPATSPASGAEVTAGSSSKNGKAELSAEEQQEVDELKSRDREVRQHEQAHVAAGGSYTRGGPRFEYTTGPDNRRYATGGEVDIDTSKVPDDPEGTIRKMQVVYRAAMAPAEPSGADRSVAAEAKQKQSEARAELAQARRVDASDGEKTGGKAAGVPPHSTEATGESASESADEKSATPASGEFVAGPEPGRILDEMA